MNSFTYTPIGVIRSPFKDREGMPIQPTGAKDVEGEALIDDKYRAGLEDLADFSHIILIYLFHKRSGYDLSVKPFMDETERGLFATRAPRRPNPIGISVVRLLAVEGSVLRLRGVDVLDGTPLLDIKPYVAAFDAPPADRFGWLEENAKKAEQARSDGRFKG